MLCIVKCIQKLRSLTEVPEQKFPKYSVLSFCYLSPGVGYTCLIMDSNSWFFCWLCEPRTHYSLFLGGSLFQRLKAKCERFTVNFLEFTDMT